MKRRATACFVPRWIKKSSSLSVSLQRIISPKSEQINNLKKKKNSQHPFVNVFQSLCAFLPLCLAHTYFVCRCVTTPMFVHVSVCVPVNSRLNRNHEEVMVISVSALAQGSMIKTLNQTPCSNITAESYNFNFFRPVDTNKLDMSPSNINQPLQESPGCCNGGLFFCEINSFHANIARPCNFGQHESSFQKRWRL